MIRKILIGLILLSSLVLGQALRFGEAKGLFMSVGVGPRIPISDFSETHNVGIGFDVAFSYADNLLLPMFIYGDIGFQHFPGTQAFYKVSDHSAISSNTIVVNLGGRHYYAPLVENIVLLMPVVEAGVSLSYFETSHTYKVDTGKRNMVEDKFMFGFNAGIGVSMFLLDVMAHYHYFHSKQYISFDLRVRIPVFVTY